MFEYRTRAREKNDIQFNVFISIVQVKFIFVVHIEGRKYISMYMLIWSIHVTHDKEKLLVLNPSPSWEPCEEQWLSWQDRPIGGIMAWMQVTRHV